MRIKIFLKKLVTIGVTAIFAFMLVGCFDLGIFEDEQTYYSVFGDVILVYQNPNVAEKDIENKDYSVKDYFYNKNTGENFGYGDPKDEESDEGKDIPVTISASDLSDILKAKFKGGFKFSGVTGDNIKWQANGYVDKGAVKYVIKEATK